MSVEKNFKIKYIDEEWINKELLNMAIGDIQIQEIN